MKAAGSFSKQAVIWSEVGRDLLRPAQSKDPWLEISVSANGLGVRTPGNP
jgi:hypothetical protein